jgi:uncharacterized protein (TIGR00369 family)
MSDASQTGPFSQGNGYPLVAIPYAAALGMAVVSFSEAQVVCKIPYDEKLIGNPDTGVVHGGVISSLLDNACGIAVTAKTKSFGAIATLDLRIDYMKPATPKLDIFGTAECFRVTRSIAFARAFAHHGDVNEPIATCAAVFMLKTRETQIAGSRPTETA